MTEPKHHDAPVFEGEFVFAEPPQKVWRALSLAQVREVWLPAEALVEHGPASCDPGRSISYRMRERTPPFLESEVTFAIAPDGAGGTKLRISHEPTPARARPQGQAANGNGPRMLAA